MKWARKFRNSNSNSSSVDKKRGQTRYYYVRLTILVMMMMLYSRYTIRTDGFMCVINRPFLLSSPPSLSIQEPSLQSCTRPRLPPRLLDAHSKASFALRLRPHPRLPPRVEHHDEERALKKKKDGPSPFVFFPTKRFFPPTPFQRGKALCSSPAPDPPLAV